MKGILFKPWKIKYIAETDGEIQTRRVIKPQPRRIDDAFDGTWEWREKGHYYDDLTLFSTLKDHARYQIGETVYIKEAWATLGSLDSLAPCELDPYFSPIFFKTDGEDFPVYFDKGKWRSPLFMPQWAARYFIKILDVRAERLQEISLADIQAEGIPDDRATYNAPKQVKKFQQLWDSINKPPYDWVSNPWVWVYTARRENV